LPEHAVAVAGKAVVAADVPDIADPIEQRVARSRAEALTAAAALARVRVVEAHPPRESLLH
jgi:hypothetical protein